MMNKKSVSATLRPDSHYLPVWLKLSLLFGFLCASSLMGAKLSNDLPNPTSGGQVDVIVQFMAPPSNDDFAQITSAGGSLKKKFPALHGALVTLPVAALQGIANNPRVRYISPDRKVRGTLEFAQATIGANIAQQYGWTGAGVGVAIIDSGIATNHPDLGSQGLLGRVPYSENFVAGENTTNDVYGHGTHVAGIVGGDGSASTGSSFIYTFRGIAPSSTLINLRALDSNGQGTDSAVIGAIERAIELKNYYGIHVVNLSLGRTIQKSHTLDPLCQAVAQAWAAGLVVVVAAGNNGRDNSMGTSGYGTVTSPANSPYAITVGAMKDMSTVIRAD